MDEQTQSDAAVDALRDLKPEGADGVDRTLRLDAVLRVALGRASRDRAVGRYQIREKLGEGGMGVVYRCTDPELERDVAVKFLRDHATPERRARMLAEARALARFSDPHVVAIHDVGVVADQLYFAMEYVRGGSLADWVSDQPDPAESTAVRALVELFVDAGRGLAAAHERGLVHRDFKPSNVLIGADGRARVGDFGLATATVEHASGDATDSGPQVERTSTAGTPAFMSPEQLRGQPVDARSDQYSFGKSLKFCLDHLGDAHGPRARLTRRRIDAVVARTLLDDPDHRFASMTEVVDALARATRLRRWPWLAATGLALVALGAGLPQILDDAEPGDPYPACSAGGDAVRRDYAEAEPSVAAAFAGHPDGETTLSVVDAALLGFADRWQRAWHDACEDTWRGGQQSRAALDLRLECLGRQRDYATAFLDALAQADADLIARAPMAVERLPDVDRCADLEGLTRTAPDLPPATAADLEPLERRLASLRAQLDLRVLDDVAPVERAVAQATELGHAPTLARARLLEANTRRALGLSGAGPAARASFVDALRGHDDATALLSALALASQASIRDSEFDQAAFWLDTAEAIAARGRPSQIRRAEIAEARGHAAMFRHDHAAATEQFGAAITALDGQPGQALSQAVLRVSQAQALSLAGHDARALAQVEPALDTMLARLGPGHPYTRGTRSTRATILLGMGRLDEARDAYLEQLADVGPAEFDRQVTLKLNLGELERRAGQLEAAEQHTLDAIAVLDRHDGAERHHRTAFKNLSAIYERQGRYEDALAAVREATARIPASTRLTEPQLVQGIRTNEAAVLMHLGRFDEADALLRDVIATLETELGDRHIDLLDPSLVRAEVNLALGRHPEVRASLDRATVILGQIDRDDDAQARAALLSAELALALDDPEAAARALDEASDATANVGGLYEAQAEHLRAQIAWASGDEAEALRLATDACAGLSAATTPHDRDKHRACVAWLDARR